MYTNLTNKDVIARKEHQCDWCMQKIHKGEKYNYETFIFDGEFCDWHSHLACKRIVDNIWDYCDPYDGLDSWGFDGGCHDVCRDFICPDCADWSKEYGCEKDESYCLDKMDEFFKTYELYPEKRNGWYQIWKFRKRQESEEEA